MDRQVWGDCVQEAKVRYRTVAP